MGRLTRDPDLRFTQNEKAVANFTIACDRDRTINGEKQTDFVDIVCWGSTAEFVSKYFAKGSMIVVKGRIQQRSWEDKDGNKRYITEVVADNFTVLSNKNKPEEQTEHAQDPLSTILTDETEPLGDLPF
jgi:single-strand DNA-binding protein